MYVYSLQTAIGPSFSFFPRFEAIRVRILKRTPSTSMALGMVWSAGLLLERRPVTTCMCARMGG